MRCLYAAAGALLFCEFLQYIVGCHATRHRASSPFFVKFAAADVASYTYVIVMLSNATLSRSGPIRILSYVAHVYHEYAMLQFAPVAESPRSVNEQAGYLLRPCRGLLTRRITGAAEPEQDTLRQLVAFEALIW